MAFSKVLVPKVCEHCAKPFMAKTTTTSFCCKVCSEKHLKEQRKRWNKKGVGFSLNKRRKPISIFRLGRTLKYRRLQSCLVYQKILSEDWYVRGLFLD